MKILSLLLLLSMASIGSRAQASDMSSTDGLLEMCRSNGADYGYCLGFISGTAAVMEQVGLGTNGDFRSAMGMCVSMPYPTANAEVQAFINYVLKNSQFGGKPSAVGVMLALANNWPCTGQR